MKKPTMLEDIEVELNKDTEMKEFIELRLDGMKEDVVKQGIRALMIDVWKAAKGVE